MRIHHIAVWTFRLEDMKEFYIRYFQGTSNDKYINPKKGFESYFIRFDSGTELELMSRTDVQNTAIKENRLGLTHFAFALNSKEEVLELTEKLSVSLQDELDFVRSYINLERGRVGEDFTATVTVEEGLDASRVMIPSMIIQIPVENAIKHGLVGKDGEKELTVHVSHEKNGICITICDNGRGYLPHVTSATRGTGTGLKVLYQTIQLLNTKNKSDKIRFEITNRNSGQTGTLVSVYIPFRFSYDL